MHAIKQNYIPIVTLLIEGEGSKLDLDKRFFVLFLINFTD